MIDPPALADFSDLGRAIVAVQNPTTPPQDLIAIANAQPSLGASVARHPRVFPELLAWLSQYGNDQARAAVAERRGSGTTLPQPVTPVAGPYATALASPVPTSGRSAVVRPVGQAQGAVGVPAAVAGLFFLSGALVGLYVVIRGLINANHWGDCIVPGASAVVTDGSFLDVCYGQSVSAQWGWLPMTWWAGSRVSQLLAVWLNVPLGNLVLPALGVVFLAVCAVLCLTGRARPLAKVRSRIAICVIVANALLLLMSLVDVPWVIASWRSSDADPVYATISMVIVIIERAAWILLSVWLIRAGRSDPGRLRTGFIVVAAIVILLPAVSYLAGFFTLTGAVAIGGGSLAASALWRLVWMNLGLFLFLPALFILALVRPKRDYSAS